MVLLIWPSNAILKYQLANCCGGSMKIGDVFRVRRSKHTCLGTQSLNGHAKTVASNGQARSIRGCGGKPLPSDESSHGKYSLVGWLYWNLIHAFPPEMHTRSRRNSHMCVRTCAHAHTHSTCIPTHTVAKQSAT